LATDALKDLDLALIEVPDESLGADFGYLARALRDDLRTPPAQALATMESLRRHILRSGGARMFLASSGELRAKLAPHIEALAGRLENAAHAPASGDKAALVEMRLRMRDPQAVPVHVGLYSPNKQGGVIITQ